MRKVGMVNLAKAEGFYRQQNWLQTLRYGELAATKLKQLKDRRLETVEPIDAALDCNFDALTFMGRNREAMACAEERYTMWAMNHLRNPGSMRAAFNLIESCIHNGEYEDAERYARHAYFMTAEMTDNFIPVDQQPRFLADASFYLARAILRLAGKNEGCYSPNEKQKAGEEAIMLARKALEIYTRLHGIISSGVALCMGALADVLDYFNEVDDDEIIHLFKQAIAILGRVEGSSTLNVASRTNNLGSAYSKRARRARANYDLERVLDNLEQALLHYREAARIYMVNNLADKAESSLGNAAIAEEEIREVRIARAAAAAAATRG